MNKTESKLIVSHPDGVEFYRSGLLRKWRWRITAENGRIIGASSQGYFNKHECRDNLKSVAKSAELFFFHNSNNY